VENATYSAHAKIRCAQRGISHTVVELILERGRRDYDNRGGCRYFLGKREKQKISLEFPDVIRHFGRKLDTVVVLSTDQDNRIITSFIRNKRH